VEAGDFECDHKLAETGRPRSSSIHRLGLSRRGRLGARHRLGQGEGKRLGCRSLDSRHIEGSELSPWVEIARDDTVTMRVPTPEIGNGAMTQIAMNVTEELACDWSRVRVEFCSIQRDYLEKGVYNAGFLPFFGGHGTDKVRMTRALQVGASARERLKAAAASRWHVAVAEIEAKNSVLTHVPSGRRLRYGEVAAAAAKVTLPTEPALKPQSEWTFLGKASPGKLHAPQVVNGSATLRYRCASARHGARGVDAVSRARRQVEKPSARSRAGHARRTRGGGGRSGEDQRLAGPAKVDSGVSATTRRRAESPSSRIITGRPSGRSTRFRSNGTPVRTAMEEQRTNL
jgi:hypothetical protein